MEKFITFGKINNQYKYILIYQIIRIINDYLFSDIFPKQIKPDFLSTNKFPHCILVQIFFNYLGSFIFSIFLFIYEKYQTKKDNRNDSGTLTDSLYKFSFIYESNEPNLKITKIIFIIFLSIISVEILNISYIINFTGLIYWVFDIFFVSFINLIIFEIPIYSHKKFAFIFMICFSSLFKFLSTLQYINNDSYNLFYKNHIIVIPLFIVFIICLSLVRFYSLCKMKWFLDYKFIPVKKFFILYNFIGMIILLIGCIISNFVKCVDKKIINDIDLICLIKIENENNIEYYFDSFSQFFKVLWKKDENVFLNLFYLFLFIIRTVLSGLRVLYNILIIRHLNPEFYLCAYDIYYIIIRSIGLINAIINNGDVLLEVYNVLTEIGALIGILIYLELIELKFCNLNHNLKKNIEMRSLSEYNDGDIDVNSESVKSDI